MAARLGVVMHQDRTNSGDRAPATMQELIAAAESAAFDAWKKYGLGVLDAIERSNLGEAADKASRLAQRLTQLAALADGQRQTARLIDRHRQREREDQHTQAWPNRIPWFRVASGLTLAQAAATMGSTKPSCSRTKQAISRCRRSTGAHSQISTAARRSRT
jgi:hypothetical protein